MAIESWIDTLAALWEISDGRGGTVYSYRVFEKNEFPSSISIYPCAITIPVNVDIEIGSYGGRDIWQGRTEFHIKPNVDTGGIPDVIRYFARIRTAMAANVKLGGLVAHFLPSSVLGATIEGPLSLQFGSDEPHLGLRVHWEVKELGTDTVSA